MTGVQSGSRGTLALFVGAVTGGALVAIWFMILPALMPGTGDEFAPAAGQLLGWGFISFLFATVIFAIGLVMIGLPGWWAFHRLGCPGPLAAVIWGAVATFLTTAGWDLNTHRVVLVELGDILLTLDGAVVGLVIQGIAYRPANLRPPPAPTSGAQTP